MQISANGIALEVEDHGSPSGEPLVLIMGLGMQLVAWHPAFVAMLVARGFRVIRFANRDIGLSHRFDHLGVPNLALDSIRHAVGMKISAPYTVADMADDTAGLLAALGIPAAHICGASMGGMIAQQLEVRSALISRPADPNNVQSVIEHSVKLYRLIGSPGYPAPEAYLQERLGQSVRRSYRPAGTARQMVAIAADGNRSKLLARITVPTQIIHGQADPLVPVAAGRDLAAKIAGAELDLIAGMGHDLPTELWPRFVSGIASAAARA